MIADKGNKNVQEFQLDRSSNRTGDVWHALVEGLPRSGMLYGYKVSGPGDENDGHRWDASRVLIDPYAPLVAGRARFGQRDEFENFVERVGYTSSKPASTFAQYSSICRRALTSCINSDRPKSAQAHAEGWQKQGVCARVNDRRAQHIDRCLGMQTGSTFRGTFDFTEAPFDWGAGYQRPNIPMKDLIVYEMGIRSFTADPSSEVGKGREGTFAGMMEKVCWC